VPDALGRDKETMTTLVVLWWVVGMFLVVRDIKKAQSVISITDFIPIMFLGFVGPVMFLMELLFGKKK